jgi:hypothetical protein
MMAGQSVIRLAAEKPYFCKALVVRLGRKLPTALAPWKVLRANAIDSRGADDRCWTDFCDIEGTALVHAILRRAEQA